MKLPKAIRTWMHYRIGKLASRFGLRIVPNHKFPQYKGHLIEVLSLALAFKSQQKPTLIQIGAFDGKNSDPVHDLLKTRKFRAFLMEPQRKAWELLSEYYQSFPDVTTINAAISDKDGIARLYVPRGDLSPLASLVATHASMRFGIRQSELAIEEVRVLSPTSLMGEFGIRSVDILQIDAEGMDLSILNSFIAIGIRPSVVNLETNHFSRFERSELYSIFQEHGYDYFEAGLDTTGYLRSVFAL